MKHKTFPFLFFWKHLLLTILTKYTTKNWNFVDLCQLNVIYLCFSGLFHRGMSQSGTVLNHWALASNLLNKTKELGRLFNCSLETNKVLVNCLKTVPAENITLALGNFFIFANIFPSTPFGPVIENGSNSFLNDHPYKLLKEGKINDYPWISSNVRDEGVVPIGCKIDT